MQTQFLEHELPLKELEKIGLYGNETILLEADNLAALLTGRRTDLISLKNLDAGGFIIEKLDAKISLSRAENGLVSLKVHPIHAQAQPHGLLTEHEAAVLQKGEIASIHKIHDIPGNPSAQSYVIEYDPETREFVSYDPKTVQVPYMVNHMELDEIQKQNYRNGELITLPDGTRLQHRACERSGLLSDRASLVISILMDGGISYFLLRGIRNLMGGSTQKEANSKAYQEALREMQQQNNNAERRQQQQNEQLQHSRGYGRTGAR